MAYGAANAAGLLAALLGDGWLDIVSWVALGAPAIPIARGLRAMRSRPPLLPTWRDTAGVAPRSAATDAKGAGVQGADLAMRAAANK